MSSPFDVYRKENILSIQIHAAHCIQRNTKPSYFQNTTDNLRISSPVQPLNAGQCI